ncbi:MAG: hypothetical protein NT045_00195 [Candidatus Aureabacteria bacterium]|nr:hypothetical protein [Candidatus Auribacterota bacterium]
MKRIATLLALLSVACSIPAWSDDIGTWTAIAPLNKARGGNSVVYSATTGKFYAVGGRDKYNPPGTTNIPIEEYDVASNTWTNKANLSVGVSSAGAVAVSSYIYIAGGLDDANAPTAVLQTFDPTANAVSTLAPMPAANASHAVAAIGNKIYVLGGSAVGAAGTTNYCYDIAANTWTSGAAVPTAVRRVGGATDGTYIYLIGGTDVADAKLRIVQRYNPATNTWNAIAPLTTVRGGPAAFFDGTRIWAVNGEAADFLISTEYYLDGIWTAGPATITGARSEGAAYSVEKQLAIKAGGLTGAPPEVINKAEKLSIAQPAPTPTPGVTLTLNSTSLNPNDTFTVDLTVQPLTEKFDAWGVIAGSGGIMYSFVLGKPADLYTGGKAMATRVPGLPTAFVGQIFTIKIPTGVAGDYTVIFELVHEGTPPIAPIANYESRKAFTVH